MGNYRFPICSIYTTFPGKKKKDNNQFHAEYILLEDLSDLQHHFYLQDVITVRLEISGICKELCTRVHWAPPLAWGGDGLGAGKVAE